MDNIYQHFRPEEKEFIDQVVNWKQYVEDCYAPKLTDFLDPRQIHIVQSIIGIGQQVRVHVFGGHEFCERKRVLLYPDYYTPADEDFQIALFEIKYPSKFVTITHRQVLGTLMSLGVKREKFGDILIGGHRIQFFIVKELKDYIKLEFCQVGKISIELLEMNMNEMISIGETWHEQQTTVSSLRLDAVISSIYNISRQKAQTLIQHGQVKVNWRITEQTSFICDEGDMISARGYGRSKIIVIDGQTRKEKWRILVGVMK
ncbi:RNA-binding protein [Bacillus sporothermodurans]|uniref:YlmH family RNA-binding protein n=1 Tax=Heyndrickxia sporothermodurans TaxID=46224 RepID=UPI00192C9774|nr:RNA-binding protein [Heyndrickxia sporothermodurans]MBL5796134.1 RNA-binding protein [Heyndrickxia sporothermodurans]